MLVSHFLYTEYTLYNKLDQGFAWYMVKKGQILGPRNPITKTGRPRQKPGRRVPVTDLRAERLVLRVHPDLQAILNIRSREKGLSRSQYVEKIILGWLRADPRNPKLNMTGKRVDGATEPSDLKKSNPLKFGQLWARFEQTLDLILEEKPRKEWFEDDLPADFFAAAEAEAKRLNDEPEAPDGAADGDGPAED